MQHVPAIKYAPSLAGHSPIDVAIASGDGIGPEIMAAVLSILKDAGAPLAYLPVKIGESVYRSGHSSGIEPETWDTIRSAKAFLKAPITTPQGGGFKSLNVTIRKTLGLYANVRPCVAYAPFVHTQHPSMDLVVIRENEEDLYAGIEHRQTEDVVQCLKLITRPGCERIARYAFEYARAHGRRKVTCMTKDNIMKLTDGLFRRVFEEVGAQYPEIERDHRIIDIGMARVATSPEDFDVILAPNLYGDILSDVTAEVAGSVGLSPSANIGMGHAMFEAIHGSAPDIAGKDIANPSGLLLASVMMLAHLGKPEVAARIHNAWLATIEEGIHTADIYTAGESKKRVGTREFASEVSKRLGKTPTCLAPVEYKSLPVLQAQEVSEVRRKQTKAVVGVDIFVQWDGSAEDLAARLQLFQTPKLELQMITNRGVKVWPGGFPETFLTDHWRCRFISSPYSHVAGECIAGLIGRVYANQLDFIKAETLCLFDGEAGFSLGQGQ